MIELVRFPEVGEKCPEEFESVARYFEEDVNKALLVREDWLERTLQKTDLRMVFGWLGEKQLIGGPDYLVGDWTQIDAIASLAGNRWFFGDRRLKVCSREK